MAQIQNTTIAIAGKDVWQQELSLNASGCTKWDSHLEESLEVSSKGKQSHYMIHLLNFQVSIYLFDLKIISTHNALRCLYQPSHIVKNYKHSRYHSTSELVKNYSLYIKQYFVIINELSIQKKTLRKTVIYVK